MCGIAGIVSANPGHLSCIQRMTGIIVHRGPDGEGTLCWNNVALGHRRLSILDLRDAGQQPMQYLGKYVISFNGEIYNYIPLKSQLEQEGYSFFSDTDTEVILAAYDFWKEACLSRFDGMFSFAIINKESNTVFCARDRFGIKPFYYYEKREFFAFGSEIKQFTGLNNWEPIANKKRLYDYLQFGWQDHTQETLFENVFQLQAGRYLMYDLTRFQKEIKQWYDIRKHLPVTEKTAGQTFKQLLKDSISVHLQADVKLGSCLSGGLDSASIVMMATEQLQIADKKAQLETVSSCFENVRYDEREFINSVNKKTGGINHQVFPSIDQLYQQLDAVIWHQDEPFGSTSVLAQWEVFKTAKKQHLKVLLDGQGADELLAGYHSSYGVYFGELLRQFRFKRLLSEISALKKNGLYKYEFIAREILKNVFSFSAWQFLKRFMRREKQWITYADSPSLKTNRFTSVQKMAFEQLTRSSLPAMLHWQDRNSMAFSVEARVPFLDHKIAEFCYQLSPEKKINNGTTKYIFRQAMKGILPSNVLNRKDKMGFVTPEECWMRENAAFIKKDLENAVLLSNGFINKNIIRNFNHMIEGKEKFNFVFWRALCFSKWLKIFQVKI